MAPTPASIEPRGLADVWSSVQNVLDWTVNIITTAYAYTDSIILWRQNRANDKYKKQKAEQEAYRLEQELLEEQKELNETIAAAERRGMIRLGEIKGEPFEHPEERLWAIWDSYS